MIRVFVSLMLFLFVQQSLAISMFDPDSLNGIDQRVAAGRLQFIQAGQVPYNYFVNINVSDTDWTCPDSVWINAIYLNKFANIKMLLRGMSAADTIPIDSLSGMPFDVKSVYKHGTDSLARSGAIFGIGHKVRK